MALAPLKIIRVRVRVHTPSRAMNGSALASVGGVATATTASAAAVTSRANASAIGCKAAFGKVAAQPQPAGQRRLLGQIAAQQIGIRDRRLHAAAAVAGGAGDGAGRARADLQHAAIDPGDRSAAGADRLDRGDGHHDREVADAAVMRGHDMAVTDHRDVRAGATHVHGQQVRPPSMAPSAAAAETPAAVADSSVWIGIRVASAADTTPPLDFVTGSCASGRRKASHPSSAR